MSSTINGQPTKPMPASVTAVMAKGAPKRVALSTGKKATSTVKV